MPKSLLQGRHVTFSSPLSVTSSKHSAHSKRHQRVLGTLHADLASGDLHAVTLKTYTEQEWAAEHSLAPAPPNAPN